MKTKLKPCPWCGVVPEVEHFDAGPNSAERYRVRCETLNCLMRPSTDTYSSFDDCVLAWERREKGATHEP